MPPLSTPVETARHILESRLRHVAVIMDGNRRWAKQRLLPSLIGHKSGLEALKNLVHYTGEVGLEALTVYAFSTENWGRGAEEVGYLTRLFLDALAAELDHLHRENIRIRFIGNISAFPTALKELIRDAQSQTACNTGLRFQVAANYGARDELMRAMRALAHQVKQNRLQPEDITEARIRQCLDTQDLPDPDLLIRTGGDSRISNYLLWQLAYAELYFTDALWPDFSRKSFDAAIREFARRERRYGQ